ncbi:MAG: hypothetical protein H0X63_01615 [Flavobacteriales bacterium]|nr:hypothetical protein [Flavobacteriales bacterium]
MKFFKKALRNHGSLLLVNSILFSPVGKVSIFTLLLAFCSLVDRSFLVGWTNLSGIGNIKKSKFYASIFSPSKV